MSYLYLQHHGIKGQKWGVRRYQNPDGSLTPAGRAKYGSNIQAVKRKHLKRQMKNMMRRNDSSSAKYDYEQSVKAKSSVDQTDIGKKKKAVEQFLAAAQKEAQHLGGPNAKVALGAQDAAYVNKIYSDYNEAVWKKLNTSSFRNTLSSKMLSDMGYEDTAVGREYVNSILNEFLDKRG